MKKIVIFVSGLLFGSLPHALALYSLSEPQDTAALYSLSKPQVQKYFVNRTLVSIGIDYLDGKTVNNSNSFFLDGHGMVYGKMAHKPDNEPQYDTGVYTIADNGSVYIKWKQWDGSKQLCFNMFEAKNAYITIDCNGLYHSTLMKSDIKPGNQLLH